MEKKEISPGLLQVISTLQGRTEKEVNLESVFFFSVVRRRKCSHEEWRNATGR